MGLDGITWGGNRGEGDCTGRGPVDLIGFLGGGFQGWLLFRLFLRWLLLRLLFRRQAGNRL